VPGIEFRS